MCVLNIKTKYGYMDKQNFFRETCAFLGFEYKLAKVRNCLCIQLRAWRHFPTPLDKSACPSFLPAHVLPFISVPGELEEARGAYWEVLNMLQPHTLHLKVSTRCWGERPSLRHRCLRRCVWGRVLSWYTQEHCLEVIRSGFMPLCSWTLCLVGLAHLHDH